MFKAFNKQWFKAMIYFLFIPKAMIQGDQLFMAVCFSYLVQCTYTVAYTGQVTFYKVPEKPGHVYLVTLYVKKVSKFSSQICFV